MTFNSYIINDEVIFNMDVNELQPVAGKDHEAITLNTPTARCLQLLLESNGNIISRDEFYPLCGKSVVSLFRKILFIKISPC